MAFAHTIHRPRLAQSLIDYVFVVGLVAAALIVMQVYMRRGVQAGIKFASDELGSQEGIEFESNYTSGEFTALTTTTDVERREAVATGGSLRRDIVREVANTEGSVEFISMEPEE